MRGRPMAFEHDRPDHGVTRLETRLDKKLNARGPRRRTVTPAVRFGRLRSLERNFEAGC